LAMSGPAAKITNGRRSRTESPIRKSPATASIVVPLTTGHTTGDV
jgi:hypothetical protein